MLEAADQALVNDLTGAPSLKQRRALAKIITLLESTRLDHRHRADDVLNSLLPKTGKSFRLGISGVPGVGKSTLIESLGLYLIEKGHKAVNVIWATGKRADHTVTNITSIVQYRDTLKIVMLDDYSKIFLLPKRFEKWYTATTPISLIPIGNVSGIHSQNLFYPLKNDTLTIGYRTGSSNHVLQDGIVIIEHNEGDLLLMECID